VIDVGDSRALRVLLRPREQEGLQPEAQCKKNKRVSKTTPYAKESLHVCAILSQVGFSNHRDKDTVHG
jgi:hypothetical protein